MPIVAVRADVPSLQLSITANLRMGPPQPGGYPITRHRVEVGEYDPRHVAHTTDPIALAASLSPTRHTAADSSNLGGMQSRVNISRSVGRGLEVIG